MERVDFAHPANQGVLAFLASRERGAHYVASAAPGSVDSYELGTHPDLVQLLWDGIDAQLPKRSAWIVHGRPALVRKHSGLIFGFATGTLSIALRVPPARLADFGLGPAERVYTVRSRAVADLSSCGPEWHFVAYGARQLEIALAAYEHAGPSADSNAP